MGVVVVVALSAICVVLVATVIGQRRRIDALTAALADAAGDDVAEVITIEIRNHAEVAVSRTALAKPLALLTPGILRGIVHRETVKMMRSELADNGVDADVRLRRFDPMASGRDTLDHDDDGDDDEDDDVEAQDAAL